MRLRATVWTRRAVAEAVEGDTAIQRRIVELDVVDDRTFKAVVRDEYTRDVDDDVWFGPIGEPWGAR